MGWPKPEKPINAGQSENKPENAGHTRKQQKGEYDTYMTAPLSSGRPGRSEMSHGDGAYPHPESDYQTQRALVFDVQADKHDANRDYRAQKRLDATNPEEIEEDMLYVLGNPDSFGPGPKLIKEKKRIPSGTYKQPTYRYGVNRQE